MDRTITAKQIALGLFGRINTEKHRLNIIDFEPPIITYDSREIPTWKIECKLNSKYFFKFKVFREDSIDVQYFPISYNYKTIMESKKRMDGSDVFDRFSDWLRIIERGFTQETYQRYLSYFNSDDTRKTDITENEQQQILSYHYLMNIKIAESERFSNELKQALIYAGNELIKKIQNKQIPSWKIWQKEWLLAITSIFTLYQITEELVKHWSEISSFCWGVISPKMLQGIDLLKLLMSGR